MIYVDIKRMLVSNFGNTVFINKLCDEIKEIYKKISSNSHIDFDMALPGRFYDDDIKLYFLTFIII